MSEHRLKRYLPINTLVGRFFFASLIVLPLFIAISAALLINTFEHSQLRAEQQRLQAHFYLLLSQTELEDKPQLPNALTEPRFNQQNSGLYGFIYDIQGNELWRSSSAELISRSFYRAENAFAPGKEYFNQQPSESKKANNARNIFSFDIEWINLDNNITPLRYVIVSDSLALDAEISSYRKRLWQWLGIMGIALIIIQMVIMRWGLSPLKRLSYELTELQENKIQKLNNDYPKEIQPVAENFNNILEHEKHQRERYRNTMSDLAHSLKTPLAVMQSQVDNTKASSTVLQEQIQRINQIISHQLQRAVIKVNQRALGLTSDKVFLLPMVKRLTKILDKVYADKQMQFELMIDEDVAFFGDEADLLETLGNLLDNACKYSNGHVVVTADIVAEQLTILISDNGKGIPENLQETLLARGARGDTAQAGQGIGLSVAVDILSSYGGSLKVTNNIGQPHLGGACFTATFPLPSVQA